MRAFVTGATGFVGAAVARRLQERGWELRLLARPGSDHRNVQSLKAEIVEGDLLNTGGFASSLEGCDALFHVAADYRLWVPNPAEMDAINIIGTQRLLKAAKAAHIPRMVYTSSVATLGKDPEGRPANEETPGDLTQMIGTYKRSKYRAEQAVKAMIADGLPCVIVNPSTPVGPGDIKPTPTGRILVEAAKGRMRAYVETGLNIVHVEDVAAGHLLAFEKGQIGQRYILGGHDMSLQDILSTIAVICGQSEFKVRLPHGFVLPIAYAIEAAARLFRFQPFATVDGVRMAKTPMFFSSAKAERELGYNFRPAREAIRDALLWFYQEGYIPVRPIHA